MTLTSPTTDAEMVAEPTRRRRTGRWIDDGNPEDEQFWSETGAKVARRNLIWSIFSEHLGFSVWLIWSVSSAFLLAFGLPHHALSSCSSWSRSPTWSGSLLRGALHADGRL